MRLKTLISIGIMVSMALLFTLSATAQNRKMSTWVRQAVKMQQAQQKSAEELHRASAAPCYLTAFVKTDNETLLADYGCKTYASYEHEEFDRPPEKKPEAPKASAPEDDDDDIWEK